MGRKPLGRIKRNWSPAMAYVIGLITTDGCLYSDSKMMEFNSKDLCQVQTVKKILGISNRITPKKSGYTGKKDYFHIQFGDKLFYQWLVSIGLKACKSKILTELKVPDQYFAHFLRGCFDGDGSIYAYWDVRWRNSFMYYVSFASASPPFLFWMRRQVRQIIGAQGHINSAGKGTAQLKYSKHEAAKIILALYKNSMGMRLPRKYNKVLAILARDPYLAHTRAQVAEPEYAHA